MSELGEYEVDVLVRRGSIKGTFLMTEEEAQRVGARRVGEKSRGAQNKARTPENKAAEPPTPTSAAKPSRKGKR